jgi:hypothetical protein
MTFQEEKTDSCMIAISSCGQSYLPCGFNDMFHFYGLEIVQLNIEGENYFI